MRQLHIRAQSGPRPVTAAAVRALIADGSLDPTSPVLSLDSGRTWQPVEAALNVIDGLAVDDHAVDRALRVGALHPIAMPLGGVAIILLASGISFSGAPAAQAIRDTPAVASIAAIAVATTVVAGVEAGVTGAASGLGQLGGALMHAGSEQVRMPESAPEAAPATTGDLLEAWRVLLADSASSQEDWQKSAEALGKRTVAAGIAGWDAKLTVLEKVTDADRARMTAGFSGAGVAVRLAMFDLAGAQTGTERIELMLLVEDAKLATTCDGLTDAKRNLRLAAQITSVAPDAKQRAAVFQGTLRSIE
ncbi:MAG TPA: hypothetical protein DCS97_15570 [Planctomycetes bacterium]|nr:hypothetical protein [Planctomycetota bacterium]